MLKTTIDNLAIFGGNPAFSTKLHVGRPNLGDRTRLLARIEEILDRNWLTNTGPCTQEFERRIADFVGVRHCIATCNGTIALALAIRALNLTGEVIIPSFTFVATAHALKWQKITPVFCDIEERTYTIDAGKVEQLITPRTTGIIGVHLWGRTCDIDVLTEVARRHHLKLLFDAAHAFACSHRGNLVGTAGNAEVFSFHATKFINSFEGGAITTNDDRLAKKLRLMSNFGFTGEDQVDYLGINGKMSEVAAAMGLTSLESIEKFISVNHRNYWLYQTMLDRVPGVRLLVFDESERCNYQYVTIEIDQANAGIDRDGLLNVLKAERVRARRYFYPGCHNMEPYQSYFPNARLVLPTTERLMRKVICLPTGISASEEDITKLCELIRFIASHGEEITHKLSLAS